MNTIPTTFSPPLPSYTVVGGSGGPRKKERGITLLLIHRGGIIDRASLLESIDELGIDEIISLESSGDTYQLEHLVARFPGVRFVLFHHPLNIGEQINVGVQEATHSWCAVLWSDYRIDPDTLSLSFQSMRNEPPVLCIAPWVFSEKHIPLPVLHVPAYHKNKLKVLSIVPQKEEALDLFPFDYCGLYHKETFVRLGGYDYHLPNPYWQKLDFGFRAFLWGEKIICRKRFNGLYYESDAVEDTTPDESYRIFFLKNLALVFTGDRCELPARKFFPFYFHSGAGILSAYREFRAAKRWVEINAYRFKMDSQTVTELWEDPEA